MKKLVLTLIAAFMVSAASAFSFDWGVTGGINYTKVDIKNISTTNFKDGGNQAGWFAGARLNLGLIAGVSLNGSLVYNQNKLKVEDATTGLAETETERSISIPLNVRYNIGLGKTGVYVGTGPQFDFMIGDKSWKIAELSETTQSTFKRDNMATSWNISAGVKVLGKVEIGATYTFALGEVGESLVNELGDHLGGLELPKGGVKLDRNTFSIQATYYF